MSFVQTPTFTLAALPRANGDRAAVPAAARNVRRVSLDIIRHDKGRPVFAAKHAVGFVIADDLFFYRIESKNASKAIRRIREVYERRRDVGLLDRRMDVFR